MKQLFGRIELQKGTRTHTIIRIHIRLTRSARSLTHICLAIRALQAPVIAHTDAVTHVMRLARRTLVVSTVFALKARCTVAGVVVVESVSNARTVGASTQSFGVAFGLACACVRIRNPIVGVIQMVFASEKAGTIGGWTRIVPEDRIIQHQIRTS